MVIRIIRYTFSESMFMLVITFLFNVYCKTANDTLNRVKEQYKENNVLKR